MKKTAMILCAGLGTRLRPLTDTMPKALVTYKGVPMLERLILKLKEAEFNRIVINVHHFADMICEFVSSKNNFGIDILFSDERDFLRDTGGGIKHAKHLLINEDNSDAPILIHNVDIISDIDLKSFYENALKGDAIASLLVNDRQSSRYLLFEKGGELRLRGWTNVETGEIRSPLGSIDPLDYISLAFSGIHIISRKIFPLMEQCSEKFSIIDFYLSIAASYSVTGVSAPEKCLIKDVGKLNYSEL